MDTDKPSQAGMLTGSHKTSESTPDALRRRPEGGDHELTKTAMEWLRSLDESMRPAELAMRFPRIANRLALLWAEPDMIRAYFDDLLIDKRGSRQGLPFEVIMEINRLQDYYQQVLHPDHRTVWDEAFHPEDDRG